MDQIKFTVFADLHYYPGVFYSDGRNRLQSIMQRAVRSGSSLIISLGDFCHSPSSFPEIIEDCRKSPLPFYHVMGNHDSDGTSTAEVLKLYNMPKEYYHVDIAGFRFVMIDTNYYSHPGGTTHFQYRNYFDFPDVREVLPREELDYLEEAILGSPYPCILCSHASLERGKYSAGLTNQSAVIDIIRRANCGNRKKVLMSLNGHHHRDHIRIWENMVYFDVNSATFDWLNNPHQLFPMEFRKEYELADHQAIYNDPLSAVITVSGDGTIRIEGSSSTFLYGVTREMTDNAPADGAGRPCVAEIQSACFKLL